MANVIENCIEIYGNATVMDFWRDQVTKLAAFVNDNAGLYAYLWPDHDFETLDLTELTGTKWFYLEDDPDIDDTYCVLRVRSAWGPCDKYVFGLYQQLAAIDPAVGVKNTWTDDDEGYLTGVCAYFAHDGVIYEKAATIGYDELSLVTDYEDEDFFDVKFYQRDELFRAASPVVVGLAPQNKQ